MKNSKEKLAILIDHSNLKHTWQEIRHIFEAKKIDYTKLINLVTHDHELLYKIVFLNKELAGTRLCNFFNKENFETIEKTPKKITSEKGKYYRRKCNLDSELTIIAMQMVFDRKLYPQKPDKVVIVSGDSDFEMLGNTLIGYGVDVEFAFLSKGFARELWENFPHKTLDNMPVWTDRIF